MADLTDLPQRLRDPARATNWGAADNLMNEAADEIERLGVELQRERMRLAACGVVALANTPDSAAKARDMHPDYGSGSCDAVAHAVDEQMRLRTEHESACKLVAEMHAAAVGYVGGPQVGAVEDVAALRTEIERLRAERDALRADAERYRKLRDSAFVSAPIVVDPLNMSMVYSGDSLDAALDALPGEAHD